MRFISCGFRSRYCAFNWPWSTIIAPSQFVRVWRLYVMRWSDGWEVFWEPR